MVVVSWMIVIGTAVTSLLFVLWCDAMIFRRYEVRLDLELWLHGMLVLYSFVSSNKRAMLCPLRGILRGFNRTELCLSH